MRRVTWFVVLMFLCIGCTGGGTGGLVNRDGVNLHWTYDGQGYVAEMDERPFRRDQSVRVRPIANVGWEFVGWQGDTLLPLEDGEYEIVLDREKRITAQFSSAYPYHFVHFVVNPHSIPYTFSAVAVDTENNIYALFGEEDKVAVVTSQGVSYWGSSGLSEGQLRYPVAIAVDDSGHVYVAESQSLRLQKFTANGQFLKQWRQGEYELHPDRVDWQTKHIAVDDEGNIWAVDFDLFSGKTRIQVLSPSGSLQATWEQSDFLTAEDAHPYVNGLALGEETVYLLLNHTLVAYGLSTKTQLWQTAGRGDGASQMENPRSVSLSSDGRLAVADAGNDRLMFFDTDGTFLSSWGTGAGVVQGPSRMLAPNGVAFAPNNDLYFVDMGELGQLREGLDD